MPTLSQSSCRFWALRPPPRAHHPCRIAQDAPNLRYRIMRRQLALPLIVLGLFIAALPKAGASNVTAAATAAAGSGAPRYLVKYTDQSANAAVVQTVLNAGGAVTMNHPEIQAVFVESA